jgi:K+-transporting ATPase ATPase B chain
VLTQDIFISAAKSAVQKLDPRQLVKNPVMFIVEVGSAYTLLATAVAFADGRQAEALFNGAVSFWLWFTVLFGNFAEAIAEGRGKAQADALKAARSDTLARVIKNPADLESVIERSSSGLLKGELVLVKAGELIPADGEVVRGVASVDESAITGESAPVIRESGGDRSGVTGGTRVLSDWLVIRVGADPGQGFVDRMIALIEGAKRQKTPNEIALTILLAGFSVIFLLVCVSLAPFAQVASPGKIVVTTTVLVALLVCLIPTTIGGLLSAIGIAGMDRLIQRNVIATSGKAVEAAGDVDVLLLDKTGTITYGNRRAVSFHPSRGVSELEVAQAARLSSLADETPEGKSIVTLADQKFPALAAEKVSEDATFIPFSAETRMSGLDQDGVAIRKGAKDAVERYVVEHKGQTIPADLISETETIARAGGTPLWVVRDDRPLGVIYLKDVVKQGIKERFTQLRKMGIETVMITGDNPLTAAAIAAEAGVDDFLAEATPEAKLAKIRAYQAAGKLVAMTGDGTNDAPALAQADVAVAMNSGTQPAKEAANMVDLDSNPTKLIEIVEVGKQLLMTRGALTTFSIANDVAKYFAIIPAAFAPIYPGLAKLNLMGLGTPQSAILSAVIFNALIIVFLIPLALRGVSYRAVSADRLLRDNLLIYGVGGLVTPFIGIKIIDLLLVLLGVG